MSAGPRVVVVGAGVMGAVVAYRLARGGAQVRVVDASRPGGGVSAATFAVDVTPRKTPREYFEFNLEAGEEHHRLAAELGRGDWVRTGPRLDWADGESDRAALLADAARLRHWGFPAELIEPDQALRVEPQIDPGTERDRVWMLCRESAWYDPPAMVGVLLAAAAEHGATLLCGDRVIDVRRDGERVTGCVTASGTLLGCDAVVLCGGPQAAEAAASLGSSLALHRGPGVIGLTRTLASPLASIVVGRDVGVRPDGDGRALLHSYKVDSGLGEPADTTSEARAEALLGDGAVAVAGLRGAAIEELRIGVRPLPPDGLPLAGPLPGLTNALVAVTHSGAHLAPLLGRLVAAEILDGEPREELKDFRPDRFAGEPQNGGAEKVELLSRGASLPTPGAATPDPEGDRGP